MNRGTVDVRERSRKPIGDVVVDDVHVQGLSVAVEVAGKGAGVCSPHLGDGGRVVVYGPRLIYQLVVLIGVKITDAIISHVISQRIPVAGITDEVWVICLSTSQELPHGHGDGSLVHREPFS